MLAISKNKFGHAKAWHAVPICCLYVADGRQREPLSAKAYNCQFTLRIGKM